MEPRHSRFPPGPSPVPWAVQDVSSLPLSEKDSEHVERSERKGKYSYAEVAMQVLESGIHIRCGAYHSAVNCWLPSGISVMIPWSSRVRMKEGEKIIKQKKMSGPCAVAVIGPLLVCMAVTPVSAENELCAVAIDGGSLLINEDGGTDCTASAGTYVGSYIPGITYRIVVDCEYKDYNEVIGQTTQFQLKGPDGSMAAKSIFDVPLINNNWQGALSISFTPASPGAYHWEIVCSEGSESASARGDLILS
jgi:hypothetical protein